MTVKKSILQQAAKITSAYEGDGFGSLTGNSDGQYMSYGFIQFCFGQKTLQPLFKRLFEEFPEVAHTVLPESGNTLKKAIYTGTEKQWALDRQVNNVFTEPWKSALKNLGKTPEMQQIQMDAARYYFNTAANQCGQFGLYTDRAFCLFFDIAVQNGSAPYVDLSRYTDERFKMVAIVNAVVAKSRTQYQKIVKDRKMAIVNGYGTVYGDLYEYTFSDSSAFYDEAMRIPLSTLVTKKVIESPDYWMEYADGNMLCKGEYAGIMLMKATGKSSLSEAVDVLISKGLTNSPDFWKTNAVAGKTVVGSIMKTMIYRLATL